MNPEIVNLKLKYVCPYRALNSQGIPTGETLSIAEVEQARDLVMAAFGTNNVHGIDWEGTRIYQAETTAVFEWYLEEGHLAFLPLIKATREIEYFFTNHEPYMYLVEKNDKASVQDLHKLHLKLFPNPNLTLRAFNTVFQRFLAPFYSSAWLNCAKRYWKNPEPIKIERVFQNQFWFDAKNHLHPAYELLQPELESTMESLKEVTQSPGLHDLKRGGSMEMRFFHDDRIAYLNALPDHFNSFKYRYGLQIVYLAKAVLQKGDTQLYYYILQKSHLLNHINLDDSNQNSSNTDEHKYASEPETGATSCLGVLFELIFGLIKLAALLFSLAQLVQQCMG
jgi:hypothetical protein